MNRAILGAVVALFATSVLAQTKPVEKKLIEFGWDEPTTAFMRAHITEMEQTPFDGTVFTIEARDKDGKPLNFLGGAWSTRKFTEAELKSSR